MEDYEKYVSELRGLVRRRLTGRCTLTDSQTAAALDGQASARLRSLVDLETRRNSGAFFSGSELAELAIKNIAHTLNYRSYVYDPACGAGDLLIACARYIGAKSTFEDTVQFWNKCFGGRDIHRQFVNAAKLRILLLAHSLCVDDSNGKIPRLQNLCPGIRAGSGLAQTVELKRATHIIMNPPFGYTQAPHHCLWRTGKVNLAAVFMEHVAENATSGARIIAILPEVLRSGSGYSAWRQKMEHLLEPETITVHGRFAPWADVDVFIFRGTKRSGRRATISVWQSPQPSRALKVSTLFDVSVGPVVDYRDPHLGEWRPFATPKTVPAWKVVRTITGRRRTLRPSIPPPFVVVRRTSSPRDRQRATASIITGKELVAVENHLIVARPKDGTLKTCRRLLMSLKDPRTTEWLNNRIRCRHLTVSEVNELPMWNE